MKNSLTYYFLLFLILCTSCSEKAEELRNTRETKPELTLPFESLTLNSLSDFNAPEENWKIAGGVYVDRSKANQLSITEGSGILANVPEPKKQSNLVSVFEHGDIEFECDVMMPVNSNSGIYFQSRYEVQLFDSWGPAARPPTKPFPAVSAARCVGQ